MTEEKKNGGRPAHYNAEQVRKAVDMLCDGGTPLDQITGATVKPVLCREFHVSPGINAQSLDKPVHLVLQERAEEERAALLKSVPESAAPVVDALVGQVKDEVMLVIARQSRDIAADAARECDELRRDKTNAHWRIEELEEELRTQQQQLGELEKQRDAARTDAEAVRAELAEVRAALTKAEQENQPFDRLSAALEDPATRGELRQLLLSLIESDGPRPTA